MKTQIMRPNKALVQPLVNQLNAQILVCQAQVSEDFPEMSKYFEETAMIEVVENTGPIEPHNLSAFLELMEAMVDGYSCSKNETRNV